MAAWTDDPRYYARCTQCCRVRGDCHHSHTFEVQFFPTTEAFMAACDAVIATATGDDGISHADPATIADAVGESVADTLRPVEHLTRDCVVMAGDLHVYRLDPDGGIAMGTERSKAAHWTRAEAESAVTLLGEGYRVAR